MVEKTNGTTALSLQMPAGQSAMIRDIFCDLAAAGAEDIDVSVDRKRIFSFVAPSTWYLLGSDHPAGAYSILSEIIKAGLFQGIPLGEGETLEITGPGAGDYMEAVYDLYDAPDISPMSMNGSKSKSYQLFQVVSNAGTRATAGDLELNQSDLDTIFPQFPGGAVVPANLRMELRCLFGSTATKGGGAANGEFTQYLKMLRDREDILDKDLTGMTFLGDATYVTAAVEYRSEACRFGVSGSFALPHIVVFDPPIVFESGSELNVIATIGRTGAAADFAAGDIKVGMLFDVYAD
tara:strand:+ start:698 stop:1576 length:879 start_codon:yes stop_codon:yes gene_type:complete